MKVISRFPSSILTVCLLLLSHLLASCQAQIVYNFNSEAYTAEEGQQVEIVIIRASTDTTIRTTIVVIQEGGEDIIGTSLVAVFQPSDITSTVSFATINDDKPEPDETFTVILQSADPQVEIGDISKANITIKANDNAAGIFSLKSTERISLSEGEVVTVTVERTAGAFGDVVIFYELRGSQQDVEPASGSLMFGEDDRTKVIELSAVDDGKVEDEEVFTLSIYTNQSDVLVVNALRQIVIQDNDVHVSLTEDTVYFHEEQNTYTAMLQLQVDRGQGTAVQDISVTYSVSGKSAEKNKDFSLGSDVVTFNSGELVGNISIVILADNIPELAEELQVSLISIEGNAVISTPNTTTIVILGNDDQHGVITFDPSQQSLMYINEDQTLSSVTLTIKREAGTFGQISVLYNISASESVAGNISPSSGEVIMQDGESTASFTLQAVDNFIPEVSQAFTVTLISVSGGARLAGVQEKSVIIQDSDIAHGMIQWSSGTHAITTVTTPRYLTWTVERIGGSIGDVAVTFTCSYSVNGVVIPGALATNRPYQMVIVAGQTVATATVNIGTSTFLSVDGRFEAIIDEVKLLTEFPVPSFNSPFKGAAHSDSIVVRSSDANGEIGFSDLSTHRVTEPDFGVNKVSIPISREGTSGAATVSWAIQGLKPSTIDSHDVTSMSGTVILLSGSSVVNIELEVVADNISETAELMVVILKAVQPSNTQRLRANFTQVTVIIEENDNPGGVFQLTDESARHIEKVEGDPFTLSVERIGGNLVARTIFYSMSSTGNSEFFGPTGLLTFNAGENLKTIQIIVVDDAIPELSETYSFSIKSHNEPLAVVGFQKSTNITILENDFPYGQIHFLADTRYTLYESKGSNISKVQVVVIRDAGTFGSVVVSWRFAANGTSDFTPVSGIAEFQPGEDMAFIEVSSTADQLPEDIEEFEIELVSASSGAVLTSPNHTTLFIIRNDAAVFFKGPPMLYVTEGDKATLAVQRADSSRSASVKYRTKNHTADSNDYQQIVGEIFFAKGQSEALITVEVKDDNEPETLELFYIELFEPEGDLVVHNLTEIIVLIQANDESNGVFKFGGPYNMRVKEGDNLVLGILRDRGTIRSVTLEWKVLVNGSSLAPGEEFAQERGYITFEEGQTEQNLELSVLSDGIPEYEEEYVVQIVNVTGGGPGAEQGVISLSHHSVTMTIVTNDNPNGVLVFNLDSRELTVAEDFIEGFENSTMITFNVLREQGLFGDIKVLWEVYSSQVAGVLPKISDILFLSEVRSELLIVDTGGREGTQSEVYNFTGSSESYALLEPEYQVDWLVGDFALSVWVKPEPGCNGYILTKASEGQTQIYYSLRMTADSLGVPVTVVLSVLGYDTMTLSVLQTLWGTSAKDDVRDKNSWHHVLVNVAGDAADFIFNGALSAQKQIPASRFDKSGVVYIGSTISAEEKYTGLMQDLRLFNRNLSPVEIAETVKYPSRLDVAPISGLLYLSDGEMNSFISLRAVQDVEAESSEVFSIKLISIKGGAIISSTDSIAKLTVLKSDYSNGLFGFDGPCQPFQAASEGLTYSCMVKRERGDAGTVTLSWRIDEILNNGTTVENYGDFDSSAGQIVFSPGQLLQGITFVAADDSLPELTEHFQVVLVSAHSIDGQQTTPISGASIDPRISTTNISLLENDLPYGLLQFSKTTDKIPETDTDILPVSESQPEIRVEEGVGVVYILVERAQGLIGDVDVEWKTEDGTAKSTGVTSPDFVSGVGGIRFTEGQTYAYINITIMDDAIAEDDKHFLVLLVNPSGGATLGLASTIKVIISHSDDAYGVIQFDHVSLTKFASESMDDASDLNLKIIRTGGLIGNTKVSWTILDDLQSDFLSPSGIAELSDGESQATIAVKIRPDSIPELDEIFRVQLTNTSQGRLGNSIISTITILANEDPYGIFLISADSKSIHVAEADAEVNITVTRTMGLLGVVTLGYRTLAADQQSQHYPVGVSRADEADYLPTNSFINFAENQSNHSFVITLREDEIPEDDEYLFVELVSVSLVSGGQERPLANSPRLGPASDVFSQIVIGTNDDGNGVLQLSSSQVITSEGTVTPILYVNRSAGLFGEVVVRFEVIPGNATANVDYFFTSNNVILFEEETSKQMPIFINDDSFPELSETFTVRLMPYITGGATLGALTDCLVVIQPSDDPQGVFEFSSPLLTVDEPATGLQQVDVRVNRMGGTMHIVAVHWTATSTITEMLADEDIEPSYGIIYFTSNQASQVIRIHVKADTIPEPTELVVFNLTHATNGGRIGLNRLFTLRIRSNDNPHGTVEFTAEEFKLVENETSSIQNVTVVRSGGTFGELIVYYSTDMIDLIKLAQGIMPTDTGYLWFYTDPLAGFSNASGTMLDKSSQANPLQACAEFCLLQSTCVCFMMNQTSLTCNWFEMVPIVQESETADLITFYSKLDARVNNLYNTQALSEDDYQTVTVGSAVIPNGKSIAQLPISIIADLQPELDEKFHVILNRVELRAGSADRLINEPSLGERTTATAIIGYNDNANGIIRIYSRDPRALDGGQTVYVEEREHFSVELVVERTGGTIGDVSVTWSIYTSSSNASRDTDYVADGAILTFSAGEAIRVITIGIQDDEIPENDEVLVVQLTNAERGALLDYRDKVNIIIYANDYVAGIIGFTSSSYIAKEGDTINIEISRSLPASGQVTVMWNILGVNEHIAAEAFVSTTGTLVFSEGEQSKMISIQVTDDELPEVNEEYQIHITNVSTEGVSSDGAAATDLQRSVASITVEASNNPHGVFTLASSSLDIELTEEHGATAYLVVDRKFGSIGLVRIYYSIISGHLTDLKDELQEAVAGADFISLDGHIDIADGQNFGHLPLNITDDDTPEVQEVFVVSLTGVELLDAIDNNKNPPTLGTTDIVTQVFIAANDGTRGQLEFPEEFHIVKVNESAQLVEISVRRAFGTYGDVSVFIYSQTSRNALLLQDYKFDAHELDFASGENSKTVTVTILDDDFPEADEIFELVLASPKGGATLGDRYIAQIIIKENDGAGGVVQFASANQLNLQETFSADGFPTSADIKLTRGPGIFGSIEISYTIVDSDGIQTDDVEPSNGTITFMNLQQSAFITLSVIDDDIPEFSEHLTIKLAAQYSFFLGQVKEKQIITSKSDSPNGQLGITLANNNSEVEVEESNNSVITCQIIRSGGLLGDISVTVQTIAHTASADVGEEIHVAPVQFFDINISGYCSVGDYLMALNTRSSELFKFDGIYQHHSYIQTDNVTKCLAYQQFKQHYFVVINHSQTFLYIISENSTMNLADSIITNGAIDAVHFESEGAMFVSILAKKDDKSRYTVKTYMVESNRLLKTDNQLEFSMAQAIATISNLVIVAQNENLKIYRVAGATWALQQTLQISNVKDVAVGQEANQIMLLVAVANKIKSYRYDELSFAMVKEIESADVETVTGFRLLNNQMFIVSTTSGSSILLSGLTSVWESSTRGTMVPLRSSDQTADAALLGAFGDTNSINIISSLHQPDYIPRKIRVHFKEGETRKEVSIPILDDVIPEDTESFDIALDQPKGGATVGANNSVTVHILSNDNAHGTIEFSEDSTQLSVTEEKFDSVIQFTLRRLGGTHGTVVVSWTASASHDISSDVSPIRGTVQFSSGQDLAQLGITLKADRTAENNEWINITLTEISISGSSLPDRGATIGLLRSAMLLVLANESPYGVISWERLSVVVAEPEQDSDKTIPVVIVREQGTAGDIQVTYITSRVLSSSSDEQAISGQDYISKQGSVVMAENETRATVDIVIKADDVPETEEQFLVNITAVRLINNEESNIQPSVRSFGGVLTVVIAENDNARGIIQLDVQRNNEGRIDVYEAAGEDMLLRIKLIRDIGYFGEINVLWQILPREASAEDISTFSGTVTFKQSEREAFIELFIIDDDLPEPIEMFDVQLISVTGGATLGSFRSVRVAILKNDSPNGMFGFVQTLYSVKESNEYSERTASIQVERLQGVQGVVNVNWQLEVNAGSDFELPHSGSLVFDVGQTMNNFTLTAKVDSVLEGQEVFKVVLTSADNNADLSVTHSSAEIIIQANIGSSGHIEVVKDYRTVIVAEPDSGYDGRQIILLSRGIGTFEEVVITWAITPAKLSSFDETEGQVTFLNGQQRAEVVLQTVDNLQPELRRLFLFQVTSAAGGATVSADNAEATVVFAASDFPLGLFEFDSETAIFVSEDSSQVSVAVVRNLGVGGQVAVGYTTVPGTAHQNADYIEQTGSLVFTPGQQTQSIVIKLLADDIPEGPETLYVRLTSVTLQSPPQGYNSTKINGIQLDLPPVIGPIAERPITIRKNDNAGGIIQFEVSSTAVLVEETVGLASLVVSRGLGTYGDVVVVYNVTAETASVNEDFFLESGELIFADGVSHNSIDITVVDDAEREMNEFFQVTLTSVSGGAVLGSKTNSYVTIAKSDYPNGKFSFSGPYERTVANPQTSFNIDLSISRTEGLVGKQILNWRILGPNSFLKLDTVKDISHRDGSSSETTHGQLTWEDGEGGRRSLSLQIKEFTGWEIQKIFVLKIFDIQNNINPMDNGEIDPLASNVTIVVLKNGDPNGIIQFSAASRLEQEYLEADQEVSFFIERLEGNLGDQQILWEVVNGKTEVFPATGTVFMSEGVSAVPIRFKIVADDVPELTESFQLQLLTVIGGATMKSSANSVSFKIRYNDDPHGVFEVLSFDQKLEVHAATLQRYLNLTLSRSLGLFGTIEVSLRISYSQQSSQFPFTDSVIFEIGQTEALLIVDIVDDIFMEIDSYFTVELVNLVYLDGTSLTSAPRFGQSTSIVVPVPEIAANSYISFQNPIISIDEISQDATMTIGRKGLYGDILVSWAQGYAGDIPTGFTLGDITPHNGRITLAHNKRYVMVEVSILLPLFSDATHNLFALLLQDSPSTAAPGGAKLALSETFTELEPCGVLRFARSKVFVHESQGSVTLTIQRVYGSRNSIQVKYSTQSETALAESDFIPFYSQSVVFSERQLTADLTIPIQLDSVAERDEVFTVILDSVEALPTTDQVVSSPRISDVVPNCTVTIKANGDPYGLLDVVVFPSRIAEGNMNVVTVKVRRNGGTFGHVTVRVRTVAGGESWDQQIALIAKSTSNNTISEALSNRDTRQSATAASDYQILNEEIIFEQGEVEKELSLHVLDDDDAESDESVFIYLTEPTGGARIAEGAADGMKYGYAFFEIVRNDNWNGVIGYSVISRNVTVSEDDGGSVTLSLSRSSHALYTYDTTIQWEALFPSNPSLASDLVQASGVVVCKSLRSTCDFNIELAKDEIPEFGYSFPVRLFNPSAGSRIDPHSALAIVIVLPSDNPYGQVGFKDSYVIVDRLAEEVLIGVDRKQGSSFEVSVDYKSEDAYVNDLYRAGIQVYSANHRDDYSKSQGAVVFQDGVTFQNIRIRLTPDNVISKTYPKIFKVVISNPMSGAVLGPTTECTVMIVKSQELDVWKSQVAASIQEMNDDTIDYLVNLILDKDFNSFTKDSLTVLEDVLTQIIEEGEMRPLQTSSRQSLIAIFCKFMNPSLSVTQGRLSLIKIFERFIFTLVVGEACESERHPYPDISCKQFLFSAIKILPHRVNGYLYSSSSRNSLRLGKNSIAYRDNSTCSHLQFIEYSTPHLFAEGSLDGLLDDKVLAVNIEGPTTSATSTPSVIYRVYTSNGQRTYKRAQCVFYDEDSLLWSSGSNICRVSNELQLGSSDFVECECDHLSSYSVISQTRDKEFIGYPNYMFIIAGCSMFCILAAILVHLIFPCDGLFTVKIVVHELACSFALLGVYLLAAYLSPDSSPDQILVTAEENNYKCTVIGFVLHYFILAQFVWMLLQSVNLWLTFAKNDENTKRLHCKFVTLGYGLTALFVAAFYGFTYYIYQEHGLNPNLIYTDVSNEREMCFLNNQYTALAGVVAPFLVCLIGIFIFVGDFSGHAKHWKSYDDIFTGRVNRGEIWSVVFLWLIVIMVNITGGLHMIYNYNWMMIAFCICLVILAVFVVGYLAMLRGPCNKVKKTNNTSSEKYQSTLIVNTTGPESMLQVPHIEYPSPIPHSQPHSRPHSQPQVARNGGDLLVPVPQNQLWDHDSEDGLLNSSMVQRSPSAGFDLSSLSRRSELMPENDDTRDLGELIMALKEGKPDTAGHINLAASTEDDESEDTDSHQGAYDVAHRISIADTHL